MESMESMESMIALAANSPVVMTSTRNVIIPPKAHRLLLPALTSYHLPRYDGIVDHS